MAEWIMQIGTASGFRHHSVKGSNPFLATIWLSGEIGSTQRIQNPWSKDVSVRVRVELHNEGVVRVVIGNGLQTHVRRFESDLLLN